MAARMTDFLTGQGVAVRWVTNAPDFNHATSQIAHRPGARAVAATLRDKLPIEMPLVEDRRQRADVKLTLGADLIPFDLELADTPSRAVIEVANGAGRNRMATRIGEYLSSQGLHVGRISNADHFEHTATTVYFRAGHRAQAQVHVVTQPWREL